MKFLFKKIITVVLIVFIIAAITRVGTAVAEEVEENELTSEAAIVIDFCTGLVIFELNADEQRVPASMTKMIAVFVVMDAIKAGQISFDSNVIIGESTSIFSYNRGYSNVPLPANSSYTIRELLDVVIVRSASAATIALGEALFGSENAFVAKMNEKMTHLGIEASFFDSWGGSPNNRISARGMAEITRILINEHPEVLDFTSQSSVTFDEIEYRSTNLLLREYEGIDGLKTGFTNPAGWCFTGTALQEDRRIISVTMGSVQGNRFTDSVILLDHGFENYGITIANHFRNAIQQPDIEQNIGFLIPITTYNIDLAKYIELRALALILNDY